MSLLKAIQEGDLQTFQQLLASGADVKAKDAHGHTPLHYAARNTSGAAVKMVELMLAQGADVHVKDNAGRTPLHHAAYNTSEHAVKMVELMLAQGADVNVKGNYGLTPLHYAASNTTDHAVKIFRLMLAHGADVTVQDYDGPGCAPLHFVAINRSEQAGTMAELMLAHGADVNVRASDGWTPLHFAATNTSEHAVNIVELMLAQGADVHVKNKAGETALDIAREKGHRAVVSLLTRWSLGLAELASEGHTVALARKLDTGADVEVLVTQAVEELEGVGGLKETLLGIVQQVQVRRSDGRDTVGLLRNYLFYGSAGTGKTTGARMLARVLHAFGLLTKNHMEERSAQGLTGENAGQSRTRVEEAMEAARGGVLFVDEAYMLGGDPCGHEAMAKLLSMMTEDGYRDSTVVVMAGSRDRMRGLLQRNTGLQSRFTKTVHFPDWSPAQCTRFVQKLADGAKPPWVFEPACKEAAHAGLDECFKQLRQQPGWASARDAQHMFDEVVGQRDRRVAEAPGSPPGITADDTAEACKRFLEARRDAHMWDSGSAEVQTPEHHYQNTMQESTESLICFLAEGLQDSRDC